MPKKNGVMKTYSFNKETIDQINYLANALKLKPTSVIEFVVDKEFKEKLYENNKCKD